MKMPNIQELCFLLQKWDPYPLTKELPIFLLSKGYNKRCNTIAVLEKINQASANPTRLPVQLYYTSTTISLNLETFKVSCSLKAVVFFHDGTGNYQSPRYIFSQNDSPLKLLAVEVLSLGITTNNFLIKLLNYIQYSIYTNFS